MVTWLRSGFIALLLLASVARVAPAQIVVPPPGMWGQQPNSRLNVQNPALPQVQFTQGGKYINEVPGQNGLIIGGNANPDGVWSYSGLALDTDKWEVISPANGGHGDYAGNEVYKIPLATMQWGRETNPTILLIPTQNTFGAVRWPPVYRDVGGLYGPVSAEYPPSTHRYGGVVYMPTVKKVWVGGGAIWQSGEPTGVTWHWDGATKTWERVAENVINGYLGMPAGWDDNGKRVIYWKTGIYAYDPLKPVGRRYSPLYSDNGDRGTSGMGFIDNKRNRFVFFGRPGRVNGQPGMSYYPLSGTSHAPVNLDLSGAPPNFTVVNDGPGGFHDTTRDLYVIWYGDADGGTGNRLFLINPDTGVTVTLNPGGPAPHYRDCWTRFLYYASKDLYVLFNKASENVYIFNPAALVSSPPR